MVVVAVAVATQQQEWGHKPTIVIPVSMAEICRSVGDVIVEEAEHGKQEQDQAVGHVTQQIPG